MKLVSLPTIEGDEVWVNIELIISIRKTEDEESTDIIMVNGEVYRSLETKDEIAKRCTLAS